MNITRREAVNFLGIPEKNFDNYFKHSKEINGFKKRNRWYFDKNELRAWNVMREKRTVQLNIGEYEKCFDFAIKMAYSARNSRGIGIRGVRSEVQMADDFILGILAEHGVQKFLRDKFGIRIELDLDVHPDHITPQDFDFIYENKTKRRVKLDVSVKSSKMKSCFNIIHPIEYENDERKSDVYIFTRVGLPSDHLFRILKDHSFFKNTATFLECHDGFRTISNLENIPIWICGYSLHEELEKVTKIPGQEFTGNVNHRYVKSVADMHNSDRSWENLIRSL